MRLNALRFAKGTIAMQHLKLWIITTAGVYFAQWSVLEILDYFGVIDGRNTGFLGHTIFLFIAIIFGVIITYVRELFRSKQFPQIVEYQDTFKKINWDTLITQSGSRIDIVVFYFDSWVNAHWDSLVAYMSRPNTTIRLFLSNPNDPELLAHVNRLFPEYSTELIQQKITTTYDRFLEVLKKVNVSQSRLELYYYKYPFNHSFQIFDDRYVVVSFFEMYRNKKIDSPAIVFDTEHSKHLHEYFDKELSGILADSTRIH